MADDNELPLTNDSSKHRCNTECGVFLEEVNIAFGPWYVSIVLVNAFLITIRKELLKEFTCTWKEQQYTPPCNIHLTINLF